MKIIRMVAVASMKFEPMFKMALAFLLTKPFVCSVIIGATTSNQLKENISSIDIILDEEIINEIERVHKSMPNPAP